MNEFDHGILVLLKQQRERPEKFKPEQGFGPERLRPNSHCCLGNTKMP